ncbi:sulfotransferase [Amylibacter sp.]|nr:sulfotransferase [Amylibacter sp.]
MLPLSITQITAEYKRAISLQAKGQNELALAIYSQILEIKPNIAEVHFQVGKIFYIGNKFSKSVFHFNIAITLKPNEIAIWEQYIPSLLCNIDLGTIKKAIKILKKTDIDKHTSVIFQNRLLSKANGSSVSIGNLNKSALNSIQSSILNHDYKKANVLAKALYDQNSNSPIVFELLARTFLGLGHLDEARKYFNISIKLDPTFFNALNNLGKLELKEKNYSAAISLFKSAVVIAPKASSGIYNLANAMSLNMQISDAQDLLKKALLLNLKGGNLNMLLGELSVRTGYYKDAEKYYKTAFKQEQKSADLYIKVGDIFNNASQSNTALKYYNLAQEIEPDNALIFKLKANVYREIGDFNKTLEQINKAISIEPNNIDFLMFYVNSKKIENTDLVIEKMIALFEKKSTVKSDKINLGFAITKALEDSKQFDRVFPFLKSANDNMNLNFPYDVNSAVSENDETIKYFKDFKLDNYSGMGYNDAHPIFICGMPRSGTTLVEQIISSHSSVTGAGEIGYTNIAIARTIGTKEKKLMSLSKVQPKHLEKIGSDIWTYLTHHYPGTSHITDKSIMTYKRMGLLKAAMPNCKFIIVRRDPRDNLLSIYRNRFVDNTHLYAYNLENLGTYYKQFLRIMDFWRNKMPDGFIEINYEDLINDPETHAQKLINYCNLDWENECLEFYKSERQVKTLSILQVRQPIYKSSVKAWERYEQDLQPLFKAIE